MTAQAKISGQGDFREQRRPARAPGDLQPGWGAIAGLNDRTEIDALLPLPIVVAAYRLEKAGKLPPNPEWPHDRSTRRNPGEILARPPEAYSRYLQRAPDADDREDVGADLLRCDGVAVEYEWRQHYRPFWEAPG